MDSSTRVLGQQSSPYLSPNQQDLLLAALRSQAPKTTSFNPTHNIKTEISEANPNFNMSRLDSFSAETDAQDMDNFGDEFTPELDYLDGDTSYDFDNADLGGEMIGALPGSSTDSHEKRKNPDEAGDLEEGDAKRQETQDGEKGAKKPGRKPLTSEPTTKRKAQNRAAQRAFRERKEKHLKDLETKVNDLTKASEADKHENGLLKAQVERLQTELREYRKRLATNASGTGRSPPLSASNTRSNSGPSSNFTFEFPKFGSLPAGSQMFANAAVSQPTPEFQSHRNSATPSLTHSPASMGGAYNQSSPNDGNSAERSLSPTSTLNRNDSTGTNAYSLQNHQPYQTYSTEKNMHGFASTLSAGVSDPLGDLFSPSILKGVGIDSYFSPTDLQPSTTNIPLDQQPVYNADNGGDNSAGLNRVFQFNSGSSVSDSTSPSASTPSQWNGNVNANSSCGTSPEPTNESPAIKDNIRSSFDMTSKAITAPGQVDTTATAFNFGATDFNMPAMNNFDPILYGAYRESHDAIIGDGEFNNGFFDDSFNTAPFDYASPSNLFGILSTPQPSSTLPNNIPSPQPPSKNLMAQMDKTCGGGDDETTTTASKNNATKSGPPMISCNNIWTQLQSNTDFQEGKFDLDHLCSELRQKARCSESGVMVEQSHVDAALRKLGNKKDEKEMLKKTPALMFEQKDWDNVMAKYAPNMK